ncbi:MAG TPA: PAS domain S-box protein, partial [Pyrinomonadaceae bacterium]|nr:PAS domain S-box protein [Pyrinomonadaceae bacterium]
MRFRSERSQAVRFLIAFTAPLLVAFAMALSWPAFEANPIAVYILAIVISAWYGGLIPGVVSLILSLLLADFLFIKPYYSFRVSDFDDLVRIATVAAIGIFVCIVCELMQGQRRRAEASLELARRSEERVRSTLENMLEGAQIIDRDWRYVYVNKVAAQHGGTTAEELIGKKMWEAFPGIEKTEMYLVLRECMEKRIARELENEFVNQDGVARWYQLVIQPVPEGIFILSLDITERKRSGEEIRVREERFRAVAECASDAIVIIDEDSNLLYSNKSTEKVFGYSESELKGNKLTMLMPANLRDRHFAGISEYSRTGRKHMSWDGLELPGLHKNGHEIPLEISFGEFTSDGNRNF